MSDSTPLNTLIADLRKSSNLREAFLANPETIAKHYGATLTTEQLQKLAVARELENDPLIGATMCPASSGGDANYDRSGELHRSTRLNIGVS